MFKFLQDKLKSAVSKFSKEVSDEHEESVEKKEEELLEQEKEVVEEEKQLEEQPKEEVAPIEQEVQQAVKQEEEKQLEQERIDLEKEIEEKKEKKLFGLIKRKKPKKEKKGFLKKITTKKINKDKFEELFWDMELALLENNVAVEIIEKIKQDLAKSLVGKPLTRTKITETINNTLKDSIKNVLETDKINLFDQIKEKKPFVICFVGINGSGKTTTIAKVANLLKKRDLSCVLAASDTFRAAAIDQLQHHADKLKLKLIKQDYGSDPAAVAFDAIKHAKAKKIDVVLIDTAGRMHSNDNLIDEMKKIIRVAKPDLKIFVGESITGNDCIEQAQKFNNAVEIDGIILSKADIDEKGGAALSVSYITKKPIIYIGTGQEYDDLKEFNSNIVLGSLGLN